MVESSSTSVSKPKAMGFLKTMKRLNIVLYSFFALDILAALSGLSSCLQAKDAVVADIHDDINGTLAVLEKMKSRYDITK